MGVNETPLYPATTRHDDGVLVILYLSSVDAGVEDSGLLLDQRHVEGGVKPPIRP